MKNYFLIIISLCLLVPLVHGGQEPISKTKAVFTVLKRIACASRVIARLAAKGAAFSAGKALVVTKKLVKVGFYTVLITGATLSIIDFWDCMRFFAALADIIAPAPPARPVQPAPLTPENYHDAVRARNVGFLQRYHAEKGNFWRQIRREEYAQGGHILRAAFLYAIQTRNLPTVREFLRGGGIDVNEAISFNNEQRALISMAIASDQPEIVQALVAAGADVNRRDGRGQTPLSFVIEHYRYDLPMRGIRAIIAAGANVNAQDVSADPFHNGATPLHQAVYWGWGNVEVTEALLDAGARVNCRTKNGNTPLHYAARVGNPQVMRLLVAHGGAF